MNIITTTNIFRAMSCDKKIFGTVNILKLIKTTEKWLDKNTVYFNISRSTDTANNARVIFDKDNNISPYKLLKECSLCVSNLIFCMLDDNSACKISGEGIFLYDAVFRPDVVSHNIRTCSLMLPIFDNQTFYISLLSYSEFGIKITLNDQPLISSDIIKLEMAKSIKSRGFDRIPTELLERIAIEAGKKLDLKESVLQCQINGVILPNKIRSDIVTNNHHYVAFQEISVVNPVKREYH
jgi:hypothetical protein